MLRFRVVIVAVVAVTMVICLRRYGAKGIECGRIVVEFSMSL